MKINALGAGAVVALAGISLPFATRSASADVFYHQTFESGSWWAEYSNNQHPSSQQAFSRYLGRYSNDTVTLSIAAPPAPLPGTGLRDGLEPPTGVGSGTGTNGGNGGNGGSHPQLPRYLLQFDFYAIDSWDGSDPSYGIDRFLVGVNGSSIFNETFANQHDIQSFREPDVGRIQMGYDRRWLDSIYHLSMYFETNSAWLTIAFAGSGLQGLGDESWGIDNITLSTAPSVPAPGAAAAFGLAAIGAARRRRR